MNLPDPASYSDWRGYASALSRAIIDAFPEVQLDTTTPGGQTVDPATLPTPPPGFDIVWLSETDARLFLANPAYDPPLAPDQVFIDTAALADFAVEAAKIADFAVVPVKLADLAVLTAKIADLAVLTAKIGDLQVVEAKIADLAVNTAKIANLAVDSGKIANLSVGTGKIIDLAVTTAKIDNLAVDTAQIKDAAIKTAKIDDLAVDTLKIDNHAVTTKVGGYQSGTQAGTGSNENIITIDFTLAHACDLIMTAFGSQNYFGSVPASGASLTLNDGSGEVAVAQNSTGAGAYQSNIAMGYFVSGLAAGSYEAKMFVYGGTSDEVASDCVLIIDGAFK